MILRIDTKSGIISLSAEEENNLAYELASKIVDAVINNSDTKLPLQSTNLFRSASSEKMNTGLSDTIHSRQSATPMHKMAYNNNFNNNNNFESGDEEMNDKPRKKLIFYTCPECHDTFCVMSEITNKGATIKCRCGHTETIPKSALKSGHYVCECGQQGFFKAPVTLDSVKCKKCGKVIPVTYNADLHKLEADGRDYGFHPEDEEDMSSMVLEEDTEPSNSEPNDEDIIKYSIAAEDVEQYELANSKHNEHNEH